MRTVAGRGEGGPIRVQATGRAAWWALTGSGGEEGMRGKANGMTRCKEAEEEVCEDDSGF
jgi:hypothetical protein